MVVCRMLVDRMIVIGVNGGEPDRDDRARCMIACTTLCNLVAMKDEPPIASLLLHTIQLFVSSSIDRSQRFCLRLIGQLRTATDGCCSVSSFIHFRLRNVFGRSRACAVRVLHFDTTCHQQQQQQLQQPSLCA